MLARDIMVRDMVIAKPDESPVDVGNKLLKDKISCAVVVDEGNICGMISKESFVMSMNYVGHRPLEEFLVKDFMIKKFDVINVDDPIESVVDKLLSVPYRIDRLPVVENDSVVGMISKGEITKIFSEEAKGKFLVRDLMEYEPQIVYDYTPLPDVLKQIVLSRERKLLVCAGKKVIGIITILDLAITIFERKKKGEKFTDLSAKDVMTKDPETTSAKEDAAVAAKLMVDKGIGGLPVINDKLEGIFTKADVVKGYKLFLGR